MEEGFKILSWNINGLRSQKVNFKTVLDDLGAEIICLQETKITRDQLEEVLAIVDGYYSFFSFSRKKSGYSGVATFCKKKAIPSYAQEGLGGTLGVGSLNVSSDPDPGLWDSKDLKDLDAEGRCIITQHRFQDEMGVEKMVSLINVYCPRADPDRPERAVFKLSFYELMRQRAAKLRKAGSHVVIVGDVNTSHRRIDHCDPDDNVEFEKRDDRLFLDDFFVDTSQESSEETACDNTTEFKVVDTFRYFHPRREEAFTCWNTMVNARATNYGTRIDYALCDSDFLPFVHDSFIHPDIYGSDHCPVSINLSKLKPTPPSDAIPPPMCTKFYPEFHGNQQKLSSYFKPSKGMGNLPTYINGEKKVTSGSIIDSSKCKVNSTLPSKNTKRKLTSKDAIGGDTKRKSVSGNNRQSTLSSFFIRTADPPNSSPSEPDSLSLSRSKSEDLSSFKSSSHSGSELLRSKAVLTDPLVIEKEKNTLPSCTSSTHKTSVSLPCTSSIDKTSISNTDFPNNSIGNTSSMSKTSSNTCSMNKMTDSHSSSQTSSQTSGTSWGFLMKGCPPPPMCPGHDEPCVLRTVKKKGPNLNKQFYACARGVGKEKDHNSRCNFFKWLKTPKSS